MTSEDRVHRAWPPPEDTYGNIEAMRADTGEWVAAWVYNYIAPRGSCWGCRGPAGTEHPEFTAWRWVNGEVPPPGPVAILVWRFDMAPGELQALSDHGGDEDWVALVPAPMAGDWIGWAESGTSFGCSSVSEHLLPDGRQVRIGAHS